MLELKRTRTVVHFTDATEFGGAERMILTVAGELPKFGWQPLLVHHGGAAIRRLTDGAAKLGIETRAVPPMRGPGRMGRALAFSRQLRKLAPAAFHAHLSSPSACRYALIAARLAGLPVVATVQLYMPVGGRRAILQQKLLSLAVDRYIAVSHEVYRRMSGLCLNAPRKLRTVYNGVPIGEFDHGPARASRRGDGAPSVLVVARLHSQKGLDYLLSAAALLPEARIVVAGEGGQRDSLEAQRRALALGDRVELLGHRDDIPALLREADVFVLPSLYEGLPVSVLEAMAAGTPVVATAIGGTDEVVVHGESGLLVPPRDPSALAGAIRQVLSDRDLARRLVIAAKTRVREHFSAEAATRGVSEIYGELYRAV